MQPLQTTTLLLIRHGHNDAVGQWLAGWRPGIHLSDQGLEEARRLVDRLSGLRIDAIYASPLDRTRETAAPLARDRGMPIHEVPEVGEFRMGEFDGQRFDALNANERWRRFNAVRSVTRAPGGELMLELQSRVVGALLNIADAHAGGSVAVFSHADPIRAAILYFAGMPIDFFHRLDVAPASLTAIALRPDGPAIVRMNDTGDLQGLPNF